MGKKVKKGILVIEDDSEYPNDDYLKDTPEQVEEQREAFKELYGCYPEEC